MIYTAELPEGMIACIDGTVYVGVGNTNNLKKKGSLEKEESHSR